MSIFTSHRERRLWIWTGIVLLVIYSTLGPAAALVAFLREYNLLRISIALVLLLSAGVFVWRWLQHRPSLGEIGVVIGFGLAYGWLWLRIETPEERTHLIEYGLVAALIYQALHERARNGRVVPVPAVLAVGATALLGLLDESIQALLPGRVYNIRDVGFNALAGLVVVCALLALDWVRRRRAKDQGFSN